MDATSDGQPKKPGRAKAKKAEADRRDGHPAATVAAAVTGDGAGADSVGTSGGGEVSGLNTNTVGAEELSSGPVPAAAADAAGPTTEPGVPGPVDAPAVETATAGTLSLDNPLESEADEGAGERGAGSLGGPAPGEFLDRLSLDQLDDALTAAQLAFRKAYPNFSAAIDAWMDKGGGEPKGIRILAQRDGFRRAGMAHSKAPAEHPFEAFPSHELLEALFSEPTLKVELV